MTQTHLTKRRKLVLVSTSLLLLCAAWALVVHYDMILIGTIDPGKEIRKYAREGNDEALLEIIRTPLLPFWKPFALGELIEINMARPRFVSMPNEDVDRLIEIFPKNRDGLQEFYAPHVDGELNPRLIEIVMDDSSAHGTRASAFFRLCEEDPETKEQERTLRQIWREIRNDSLRDAIKSGLLKGQRNGLSTLKLNLE